VVWQKQLVETATASVAPTTTVPDVPAAGRIVPATCVDHIEPHRGDYTKFRLGQLQSLCASCHNSTKKIIERRGYDPAIGADGMPLDPRHPIYRYDKR